MISRKIHWVSSNQLSNKQKLRMLENDLSKFYETNPDYYSNIDFTSTNWIDPNEVGYGEIVKVALQSKNICEVGCGSSNILKHHNNFESHYTGCDFSSGLMSRNKSLYPKANFLAFQEPNVLPFSDASFDFVFSVFVLEHSTDPSKLLDECSRILKPGGTLIVLCPDFLGKGRMTSQRSGWSAGTATQKLKRGRVLDAFITLYDNRVRIPSYCKKLARKASETPLFLVNLEPVVFDDPFLPDVDAVYVTFKNEIILQLKDRFVLNPSSEQIGVYEDQRQLIFLSFNKLNKE